MLIEVGEVTESLPALGALEGLLSGVDPPVLSQGGTVTEGLATLGAFVWFLSGVNFQVLSER